jgi:trans-2,3-dihydro-3-hydroxyanthranilate isomerase
VKESASTGKGRVFEYSVLDVFTRTQLQGNPLAVVLNHGALTTETMQAIAKEMNLSETTFVERRSAEVERDGGVRVRIFTPQEELPFAGHPTLGTASVIRAIAPECVASVNGQDIVTLDLNVGAIPVRFDPRPEGTAMWPMAGEMTQRDPEFGELLDSAEVAALTGLHIDDFDPAFPIQVVSTGTAFAIVPVRSASALAGLRVRQEEACAFLQARGARWFYVLGPEAQNGPSQPTSTLPVWRARMQFNGGEDPATGSAAGCAISYLVRHGAVPPDQTIHLRQGVEIARPSDLFLTASLDLYAAGKLAREPLQTAHLGKVTQVRVGGSTILVAKGELFLP